MSAPRTARRVSFLVLPAAALALAACGGGTTGASAPGASASAETSDLPSGWTRVEVAAEGFSIGVPDGWQEISAEDIGESGAIGELASANPQVADTLGQAQAMLEAGQIAFFAVDTEPDDPSVGFAANVNVINAGGAAAASGDAEAAAEEMAAAIRAQVPVNGEVTTDTETLPSGEAGIVRYEWSIAGADGAPIDVAVTQYAIVAGGSGFVITFSAPAAAADQYAPVFAEMAASFEAE